MRVEPSTLPGVLVIEPDVHEDGRGFFLETYHADRYREHGIAGRLKPSARGELEITDVNRTYLDRGQLHVEKLARGIAWLDTGTHDSLMQASNYIHAIEERQGLMVACLEEIAYRMGYISADHVARLARAMGSSAYGQYLIRMLEYEV